MTGLPFNPDWVDHALTSFLHHTMEIEIKIRLPTEEDTAKLEQALGGKPFVTEDQDNVFFEGVHKELYVSR